MNCHAAQPLCRIVKSVEIVHFALNVPSYLPSAELYHTDARRFAPSPSSPGVYNNFNYLLAACYARYPLPFSCLATHG